MFASIVNPRRQGFSSALPEPFRPDVRRDLRLGSPCQPLRWSPREHQHSPPEQGYPPAPNRYNLISQDGVAPFSSVDIPGAACPAVEKSDLAGFVWSDLKALPSTMKLR